MANLDEHSALMLAIELTRKAGEAVGAFAHLRKDERILKIAQGYERLAKELALIGSASVRKN